MARFYVGQRVRVVHCLDRELMQVIGKEGVVNEINCVNEHGKKGLIGITIEEEHDWCFFPYQLEPLTNPGREVVSWDACAWKPEHLRDKVS